MIEGVKSASGRADGKLNRLSRPAAHMHRLCAISSQNGRQHRYRRCAGGRFTFAGLAARTYIWPSAVFASRASRGNGRLRRLRVRCTQYSLSPALSSDLMFTARSLVALLACGAACVLIVVVMSELLNTAYALLEKSGLLSLSFVDVV